MVNVSFPDRGRNPRPAETYTLARREQNDYLISLMNNFTSKQIFEFETSAKNRVVILSVAKDLVFTGSYEILRSLRSLRMTGERAFAEVSICYSPIHEA
jgi:hypothetical protein